MEENGGFGAVYSKGKGEEESKGKEESGMKEEKTEEVDEYEQMFGEKAIIKKKKVKYKGSLRYGMDERWFGKDSKAKESIPRNSRANWSRLELTIIQTREVSNS